MHALLYTNPAGERSMRALDEDNPELLRAIERATVRVLHESSGSQVMPHSCQACVCVCVCVCVCLLCEIPSSRVMPFTPKQ